MGATATDSLKCGLVFDSTAGDFPTCQGAACVFWHQETNECLWVQFLIKQIAGRVEGESTRSKTNV